MSITQKKTTQSKNPCGYCNTGAHDKCPGGVLNGNGVEVYQCGCTEHPISLRCLACGARGDSVNPDTWTCIDAESCEATTGKRRRESLVALYGAAEDGTPARITPKAERAPKAPAKPKTGTCLCCGETTGGGLFRPGHDSKYLTRYVTRIKEDPSPEHALNAALAAWESQGISEALRAKLAKRVG